VAEAESQKHFPMGDRFALRVKVALTVEEAAMLIGVSERSFRDHLFVHCPKLYVGRSVRIPRRLFEKYVEELAQEEREHGRATAADLLDRTGKSSR
jgi:hypothetical protein